jgi:hypothetical protein
MLCIIVVAEVHAFSPVVLVPSLRANSPHVALCPTARGTRLGGSSIVLNEGKAQLVTYGDLWRDALNEDGEEKSVTMSEMETSSEVDDLSYAMEDLTEHASEVVKPITTAATKVASAVWNKLSPSPDNDEIQRNLKAFSKCHSGAVGTPLGDEELASEVRYLGMFPDLVDALLDAQEEQETTEGSVSEDEKTVEEALEVSRP